VECTRHASCLIPNSDHTASRDPVAATTYERTSMVLRGGMIEHTSFIPESTDIHEITFLSFTAPGNASQKASTRTSASVRAFRMMIASPHG